MRCREQKEGAWSAVFLAERRDHQVNAVEQDLLGEHNSGRQEAWFQLSLYQRWSGQTLFFICQMKARRYPASRFCLALNSQGFKALQSHKTLRF